MIEVVYHSSISIVLRRLTLGALLSTLLVSTSVADVLIVQGNLASSDDVYQYDFNVLSDGSNVTIQTYQYGGSTTIPYPAGGIDSVVALFYGVGNDALLQGYNDDGSCPPATPDSSGLCLDSTLALTGLPAGSYILAISANQNLPLGPTLGSGYTGSVSPIGTSDFYATITVDSAVPEPSSIALVLTGLAFGLFLKCRRLSSGQRVGWAAGAALMAVSLQTAASGAVIFVPSGGDFQAALNAAQPGDTISLQAGASFVGNFTPPVKPGSGFITIQTSSPALLAKTGVRVSPADAPQMAAIVAPVAAPALAFSFGSHHYKLVGLEIRGIAGLYMLDVVQIGTYETDLSQMPHDIVIDRCYIHGDAAAGSKRGIALNGANVTVQNSYISDFKSVDQDTQAINGWNGPGPFHILNNHLEAAGENVLFGSGMVLVPGLVPSDAEVRQNHFFKPLSWNPADPSYGGILYDVKMHFEIKNGQRIVVDGNIMENCWAWQGLAGRAMSLGPRVELGAVPWAVIQDVQITHNIIRNVGAGMLLFGQDDTFNYLGSLQRVTVENNLFLNVLESNSVPGFNSAGILAAVHTQANNVTVSHNTYVGAGRAIFFHFNTISGYRAENNLLQHNLLGISYNEDLFDINALNAVDPGGYVFAGNVIQGGNAALYPPGNHVVATNDNIGYANLSLFDVRLRPSSPFKNLGTDGLDIGADAATVYQLTQNVIPGSSTRCIASLNPPVSTFSAAGGAGIITVSAPSSCSWMATITPGWLTVTNGFSGVGNGQVTFSVPPYVGGTSPRAVTLSIGGLKVTVRQNQ